MTSLVVGLLSVGITYLICKKIQKREIEELSSGIKHQRKYELEICEGNLSANIEIAKRQQEIFFLISDVIHNIGCPHNKSAGIEISEEVLFAKIGRFFSMNRTLSQNLLADNYSEETYKKIVNFIEYDFYCFCHYKTNDLDLDKYWELVWIDHV